MIADLLCDLVPLPPFIWGLVIGWSVTLAVFAVALMIGSVVFTNKNE